MTPITAAILSSEQYVTGVSMLLLFNTISIFGLSVASAIETAAHAQPYLVFKIFVGSVYLIAGIILIILKLRLTGSLFARF